MNFAQLAALLYRDSIQQKHSNRDRLLVELTNQKQEELDAKKMYRKSLENTSSVDAFTELILDHLLAVPWLCFFFWIFDRIWNNGMHFYNYVQ